MYKEDSTCEKMLGFDYLYDTYDSFENHYAQESVVDYLIYLLQSGTYSEIGDFIFSGINIFSSGDATATER